MYLMYLIAFLDRSSFTKFFNLPILSGMVFNSKSVAKRQVNAAECFYDVEVSNNYKSN